MKLWEKESEEIKGSQLVNDQMIVKEKWNKTALFVPEPRENCDKKLWKAKKLYLYLYLTWKWTILLVQMHYSDGESVTKNFSGKKLPETMEKEKRRSDTLTTNDSRHDCKIISHRLKSVTFGGKKRWLTANLTFYFQSRKELKLEKRNNASSYHKWGLNEKKVKWLHNRKN